MNLLQAEFPLTRKPFADLGRCLGISQEEVIRRIAELKTREFVRQISPVFDASTLCYQTTLVAMKVAKAELDKAVPLITAHPGISHGYEREHDFNLWFTLAFPATADIEAELKQLARAISAEVTFALPAIRRFKLSAYFAMEEDGNKTSEAVSNSLSEIHSRKLELSPMDRAVINELQQDLPLVPAPFTVMAEKLGMTEEQFLARSQSLQQRGIMRRFGAAVNHRKAGFIANAMTVWVAPPEKIEIAAQQLTSLRAVSHCYERKTNPLWRYNLFAMIHGHAKDECQKIAETVSQETGLRDYALLFSTREFKKTRVKYLV